MSDGSLWEQVAGGSHGAFKVFFQRHLRRVWNHAYRLTGSWDAAEDLASLTFLTAWRKRAQVVLVRDSALPWLFTIVGNLARDEHRSAVRRDRLARRLHTVDSAPDHAESVAERLDDQLRGRRLVDALQRLPRAQRRIVELCIMGELPQSEAAAVLGIAETTVRSNLARARTRLRALAEERTT
jgi:RNA polymerase sigma-70 factor (ECF subfamily)